MYRSKAPLRAIIPLLATLGIIGLVGNAWATPEGSQNLRGMAGRMFLVEVYDVNEQTTAPNCYTFNSDGTWDDRKFPVLGSWNQHTNGAKTSYTAEALAEDFDFGIGFLTGFLLVQDGKVTPAHGKGNLQLTALTQGIALDVGFDDQGNPIESEGEDFVFGLFVSVGYEVDECPL